MSFTDTTINLIATGLVTAANVTTNNGNVYTGNLIATNQVSATNMVFSGILTPSLNTSIIQWKGGNPSTMLETYYGATDRYGLGQNGGGTLRVYTSNSFTSSVLCLGRYTTTAGPDPKDWIVCNSSGIYNQGTVYANGSLIAANVNATANVYATGPIGTTGTLTAANVNASANIYVSGPIGTSGILTAANVNSANATHAFGMSVGNLVAANVNASANIYAAGPISTSGILTAANVNATANVYATGPIGTTGTLTAANVNASANIYATGPIGTSGILTAANVNSANATHAFGMYVGNLIVANINASANIYAAGPISTSGILTAANVNATANIYTPGNVTCANLNIYAYNGVSLPVSIVGSTYSGWSNGAPATIAFVDNGNYSCNVVISTKTSGGFGTLSAPRLTVSDTNVTMGSTQVLSWGTATIQNNMISLYGTSNPADGTSYGFGLNSLKLVYNTPSTAIHSFRCANVEYANIGTSGLSTANLICTVANITSMPVVANTALALANGQMTFSLVTNTSLKIFAKGTDGVLRSATLTLA